MIDTYPNSIEVLNWLYTLITLSREENSLSNAELIRVVETALRTVVSDDVVALVKDINSLNYVVYGGSGIVGQLTGSTEFPGVD